MQIEIQPSVFDISLAAEQLVLVRESFGRASQKTFRQRPCKKGLHLALIEDLCGTDPGPEALRALRAAARLSIRDAANGFKVSRKTWKQFEDGRLSIPKAAFDFLGREAGGLRLMFPD